MRAPAPTARYNWMQDRRKAPALLPEDSWRFVKSYKWPVAYVAQVRTERGWVFGGLGQTEQEALESLESIAAYSPWLEGRAVKIVRVETGIPQ
jgi:hypothetical protein